MEPTIIKVSADNYDVTESNTRRVSKAGLKQEIADLEQMRDDIMKSSGIAGIQAEIDAKKALLNAIKNA